MTIGAEAWSLLQSVISGLIGAGVVYYFGIRQLVAQRRLAFVERQLVEFYAPLTGIRKQIRAKSELRLRVSNAASAAWQDICASYEGRPMYDHEERFAPFKRIIEYDNEQLRAELLPKYREMLTLFTERYHLAATDTRAFYQSFLEFVEIWNRWLAESLPAEVLVARAPRRERPSILRTSRIQDGGAPTRNRPGWGRPANKAMKRTGFARRLSPCR